MRTSSDLVLVTCALLLLLQDTESTEQMSVEPRQQLVREGAHFQFVCRGGKAIEGCSIKMPDGRSFIVRNGSNASAIGLQYLSTRFDAGECGLRVEKSNALHNGVYTCTISFYTTDNQLIVNANVTIAHAPERPLLKLLHEGGSRGAYVEGDTLHASCTVSKGRPAANISSWFLGEERLQSNLSKAVVTSESGQLSTVQQNVSLVLKWCHHGKLLSCEAQHAALNDTIMVQGVAVLVQFAPRPKESPIQLFDVQLGAEHVIAVNVSANPKPNASWTVGGLQLQAGGNGGGQQLQSGGNEGGMQLQERDKREYEVLKLVEVVNGTWRCQLKILNVTASDFDKNFVLTATNDFGNQNYTVEISSASGPAKEELQGVDCLSEEVYTALNVIIGLLVFGNLVLAVLNYLACKRRRMLCFKPRGNYRPQSTVETIPMAVRGGRQAASQQRASRIPAVAGTSRQQQDNSEYENPEYFKAD